MYRPFPADGLGLLTRPPAGAHLKKVACLLVATDGLPTVTVGAAYSKHRREDVLPLRPDRGERRARRRSYLLATPDGSGRVVDFHALRHTFITRLARSGIAPAVAKSLARHSTITVMMDHSRPHVHRGRAVGAGAVAGTGAAGGGARVPLGHGHRRCLCPRVSSTRRSPVATWHDVSLPDTGGPSRIRTCDQGIMSPLLCR